MSKGKGKDLMTLILSKRIQRTLDWFINWIEMFVFFSFAFIFRIYVFIEPTIVKMKYRVVQFFDECVTKTNIEHMRENFWLKMGWLPPSSIIFIDCDAVSEDKKKIAIGKLQDFYTIIYFKAAEERFHQCLISLSPKMKNLKNSCCRTKMFFDT